MKFLTCLVHEALGHEDRDGACGMKQEVEISVSRAAGQC